MGKIRRKFRFPGQIVADEIQPVNGAAPSQDRAAVVSSRLRIEHAQLLEPLKHVRSVHQRPLIPVVPGLIARQVAEGGLKMR